MDMYATLCLITCRLVACIKILPLRIVLVRWQGVQVFSRHIVIRLIGLFVIVHRYTIFLNLQHRRNDHLTVFCQLALTIIIIIVIR